MANGKWLAPRHPTKDVFEKDYSRIDLSPVTVSCPGCKGSVKLTRKAVTGRIAGWCRTCSRAVAP